MYRIYKKSLCSPIDYAAEELKKYLCMMMPTEGEVEIHYNPENKAEMQHNPENKVGMQCSCAGPEGFRLGLMQDFGLDVSDAEDTELDDILYIDTDEKGGILAGDNPRSVLLAVYEYLRQQGCRWLFPGVDGELIPVVTGVKPVHYRHKPSCRYRGQCNEGSEFQANMLEAIEFTPKVGMNVFMMEFFVPTSYYGRYYNHLHNEKNRPPEPISNETILQWKRQCEAELSKRGLQFHDIGHGWTGQPFGIDTSKRAADGDNEKLVSEEARGFLALIPGENGPSRRLVGNTPNYTQFCMSNPIARRKVVQYAADYAGSRRNVDYLHMWLGDAMNSHCECESCKKRTPSDWYIILLNELDEELTRRKLNTRIVFIVYTDTVWPPVTERLKHQERFTLLLAPISRSYTQSLPEVAGEAKTVPYQLNQMVMPDTLEKNFAYFAKWKEMWKGANVAYEYHFWKHQYRDVGGIRLSQILNDDVRAYKKHNVNGIIQDGSQRSFFPTGLLFYTYARSMYDMELTAEEIAEEYFSCAFGAHWREFYAYLKELGEVFNQKYLEREDFADREHSPYYNPAQAERLAKVPAILERGRALIKAHYNMPYRVQTASVRLLEMHARYAELLAQALIPKALGKDDEADVLYEAMKDEMGKKEIYFQTCYDHGLLFYELDSLFECRTKGLGVNIY